MTKTEQAAQTIAARAARRNARNTEYKAAKQAAPSALEAFWAGSAYASVARDYQSGRHTTVKAE